MTNRTLLNKPISPLIVLVVLLAIVSGATVGSMLGADAQAPVTTGIGPWGDAGNNRSYPGPGPEGEIELLWKVDIPEGYRAGLPVAYGNYLLVTASSLEFGHNLTVYELRTGEFLWNYAESGFFTDPVVSEDQVYLMSHGRIIALSLHSGDVVWDREIVNGAGMTGLVVDDEIVFAIANATVFALRGSDGSEIWRSRFDAALMGPPVIAGEVIVVASSTETQQADTSEISQIGRFHGISRDSGHEVWRREVASAFSQQGSPNSNFVGMIDLPGLDSENERSHGIVLDSSNGRDLWTFFCDFSAFAITQNTVICGNEGGLLDLATGDEHPVPTEWPEGLSFRAAAGNHLYLADSFRLVAVALSTGIELWSYDFPDALHQDNSEPQPFAFTVGNHAIAVAFDFSLPDGDSFDRVIYIFGNAADTSATPQSVGTPASPVAIPGS